MNSINEVNLLGNLTKDPEQKTFENGNMLCTFSMATNRQYKTDDGEKKDVPEYHNCVAYGKVSEIISKYLRKGNKAFIKGRLQTRSWDGQDGKKRYATEIVVNDIVMLTPKAKDSTGGYSEPAGVSEEDKEALQRDVELDDLPF